MGSPPSQSLRAQAKINLYLHITGPAAGGYHPLDSVALFTAFGDDLHIRAAGDNGAATAAARDKAGAGDTHTGDGANDSINITGPAAGGLETDRTPNLCIAAIRAWRDAGGHIAPLAITLDKNIPLQAGLGGGSADAAAVLRYAQTHAPTPLSHDRLMDVARGLGADVPVCLASRAQRMRGRGELLSGVGARLAGHVLLAHEGTALSTRDVFARFADTQPGRSASRPEAPQGGDAPALASLGNDLETAATRLAPGIKGLLSRLRGLEGCLAAGMSGSGGACFALFGDAAHCRGAAARLDGAGIWAVATTY